LVQEAYHQAVVPDITRPLHTPAYAFIANYFKLWN